MKKILAFLILVFCFVNVHAAKINKLIFFGDSLSDNGNLYELLFHFIPKSPPYFDGRFSNGTTWAENLAKHYYNKSYVGYHIYAVGGATAVFHMPTPEFISPTILELEIDKYLLDSAFTDRSNVLFAIWIGGNDYMFHPEDDVETSTTKIVNKIAWAIDTLRYYGGQNFLILNLPDLAKIPKMKGSGLENAVHTLAVVHNQKLDAAIEKIQQANPNINITTVDTFAIFTDVMANPDKYNKKYHTNITNLSEACWSGGIWLKASTQDLTKDIEQAITTNKMTIPPHFTAETMSTFIMNTPALMHTYQMGKSYEQGNLPCANPNEYLFWDAIHPTAVVHEILAKMVLEKMGMN